MNIRPNPQTQDYLRLKKYQKIWEQKKLLQQLYNSWYEKIEKDLIKGKTLELGSGIGNYKKFKPQIISSDIVACEWLDKRIDAHKLPYPDDSLANIVMIDVLHHLQNPLAFFKEAYRALISGGKIILIEPFPSLASLPAYKLFHPEPFKFKADLFSNPSKQTKQPWASNQAIAYLLFFKHLDKLKKIFNNKFKIAKREKFSFLVYPLSGGFENKQLIPSWLVPGVKIAESLLTPLKNLLAFRCYLVLQKI